MSFVPPPTSRAKKQRADQPMVAWWGIFPVLVFVAVKSVYGWPEAKARAIGPGGALPYLVGGVLGGLLISLLIAWVVYRLMRRSQLGASIAFSVMIGLNVFAAVAGPRRVMEKGVAHGTSTSGPSSFGAFEFELPEGWFRVVPDRKKTAAQLVLEGERRRVPIGLIMVDVGKPAQPTARDLAASFVRDGGELLAEPVRLDGIEGVRALSTSTDLSRPRHAVVAFRDGQAYLIMAAGTNGTDVTEAFEHVLKTWHWNGSH